MADTAQVSLPSDYTADYTDGYRPVRAVDFRGKIESAYGASAFSIQSMKLASFSSEQKATARVVNGTYVITPHLRPASKLMRRLSIGAKLLLVAFVGVALSILAHLVIGGPWPMVATSLFLIIVVSILILGKYIVGRAGDGGF